MNTDEKNEAQIQNSYNKSLLELAGCLRRLLKTRFIVRAQNEKWFQSIIDRKVELQKVFDTMGVKLIINESLRIAYLNTNNAEFEEVLDYQLGRKKSLSPFASTLVIYLRYQRLQYFLHPTSDPIPLVELMNLREYIEKFNTATIDNQFERAFRKALSELEELQILIETKANSGIYEITPICEILISQDQLIHLQNQMKAYFQHFTESAPEGGHNA